MPRRATKYDFGHSTVSNSGVSIAPTATSIPVADGSQFPDTADGKFTIRFPTSGEVCRVNTRVGNVFTSVTRGLPEGALGTYSGTTILDNAEVDEIWGAQDIADAEDYIPPLDASNITSGTLASARLPLATTGAFGAVKPDGSTITVSGGVISSTGGGGGGSGTVTSVGLSLPGDFIVSGSPVTGAGTLTAVRNTESANTVFAGPTTGSPASPTYRLLVAGDLPSATTSTQGAVTLASVTPTADGTGAIGSSTAAARADHVHPLVTSFTTEVTAPDLKVTGLTGSIQAMRVVGATSSGAPTTGTHLVGDAALSLADAKWYVCTVAGTPGTFVSPAGSGTVTSVGLSVPSALLNVSGSPIMSSGTIAVSLATQSANTVLAGPTAGSAATPTMRTLVAADLPAPAFSWTTKTANYTITTADSGIAVDATAGNITITLPTAVGGTQAYAIKRIDASANAVTITGAQTIDGFSSIPLVVQDQSLIVASNNANWFIEASFYPNPDTTRGDLTVTNAAGALARLGVGANKTVLGSNGTDPGYVALDLSYLGQSGAATGDLAQWNGSTWVPFTSAATVAYMPVTSGAEPMEFISDGAGRPVLTPFT